MDFWKHADGGLYVHARECEGKHPDTGLWLDGVLYHDAKTHKPYWTTFARFKERFEHVELRTSQEAWQGGAHWYFMLTLMAALIGVTLLIMLISFAWQGIETRGGAWPISAAFIIASILTYRRSRKLERSYQWDSWRRELKVASDSGSDPKGEAGTAECEASQSGGGTPHRPTPVASHPQEKR